MSQAFQTIPEAIEAWAQKTPDRVALLSAGHEPISYRQLVEQAHHLCHALNAKSVTPSQRVALCIEDQPSLALCLIGLFFHGASAIPIDPAIPTEDLGSYLQAMRADVVVSSAGENTAAKAVGDRLGLTVIEFERSSGEFSVQFDDITTAPLHRDTAPSPSDCAMILSTSGTTERKIVPRTQGELTANLDRRTSWLGLGPQHRCMNVMPLYFGSGINTGLLASLYTGGSVIIARSSDTEAFFTCLEEYKPTWYTAVYTFHRAVLSQAAKHEGVVRNASLSFLHTGGMQFPQEAVAEIEALFDAPLINTYGMAETGFIACTPLPPKARKAGTVGLQVIDEIKVIDEDGSSVAAGQTGEIVVRGPTVIKGYIDNPEANAEAFVDGWFRTGDLGFFDEDNYLSITGRLKEMINRGGIKISPFEIDTALMMQPDIVEAASFAVPHPTLGEIVGAAVVVAPGARLTEQEISDFLRSLLTPIKCPREFYFVKAIPKGPTGKIQRDRLAQMFLDKG